MTRPAFLVAGVLVLLLLGGITAFVLWKPHTEAPSARSFRDIAAEAGITWRMRFLTREQGEKYKVNLYDHGSGLAIAHYDGDGHEDIYFVNQLGPNALYRNRGDGTFEDVTAKAGVAVGDRICVAATFADYDNNGTQDLFVTSTRGGNILFRNQGDGTFKDVTERAGFKKHVGHSQQGYFFDHDNDGKLDLLLLQTASWTTTDVDREGGYYTGKENLSDTAASSREYNILYHNNGDGTFTDITSKSGLKGRGWASDAAFFDYDDDGRLDVLISCMFGPAQLYHNEGNGTFKEVTSNTLVRTAAGGMGVRAFDYDNDGKLDAFIVDMHSDMWVPRKADLSKIDETRKWSYMLISDPMAANPRSMQNERKFTDTIGLRYEDVLFGNTFHRNLGGGKFREISTYINLETLWPWGIATGDFDNNGYQDIFIPSGMGLPWAYWPNRLRMNPGDGIFVERSEQDGMEPPVGGTNLEEEVDGKPLVKSSRAAAVADLDGDGRLDIVVNNFNGPPYYFKNSFPQQNYVALRLEGTRSNRDAIGAVARAHVGKEILTRMVSSAGGYLAQSSRTLHFGLGKHDAIDRIEIRWPSGTVQVLRSPTLNTLLPVMEPEK